MEKGRVLGAAAEENDLSSEMLAKEEGTEEEAGKA